MRPSQRRLCQASEGFAKLFQGAKQVLLELERLGQLPKPPAWIPEELNEDTMLAMRLSKKFTFVSEQEFKDATGEKMPVEVPRVQLQDENNQTVTGMAISDQKHRTLEIVAVKRLQLHRQLAQSQEELRSGQNLDLLATVHGLHTKTLNLRPVSEEEYSNLKERVRRRADNKDAEAAVATEAAPLQVATKKEVEESEENEELPQSKSTAQMLLESSAPPPRAGAGQRGAKRERSSLGSKSAGSTRGVKKARTAAEPVVGADAASAVSSTTRRGGSPSRKSVDTSSAASKKKDLAKLLVLAENSLEQLNPELALSEEPVGQKKYQATRVTNALEALGVADQPQYIALKAMVDFVDRYEKYASSATLLSMKHDDRLVFYQEVFSRAKVPSNFCLNVVTVAVRQLDFEKPSSVQTWVKMGLPFRSDEQQQAGAQHEKLH